MPTATGANPATFSLTFKQNADWVGTFGITDADGDPIDLTGATVTIYVWERPDDDEPGSPTLTYTSADGDITLVEADGEWTWTIPRADLDTLSYGGIYQIYVTYADDTQDRTHQGTYALAKHGSLCDV